MSDRPSSTPYLSVVIPAYNEEARIGASLEKIAAFLGAKPYAWEMIVVDDGSSDGTADIVRGLAEKIKHLRLIQSPANEGKGSAVKRGVLASSGEVVFFTDADLSTPIEEADRFFEELKKFDVVIGSRSIQGANVVVHEPLYRELLGKTFNLFVRALCMPQFIDTQCGAKMFRREAAQKIFSRLKLTRFAFDVEALYLAQFFGYTIKELPITWYYSANTRVRTFQDGPKMLLDLLQIRWLHRGLKK